MVIFDKDAVVCICHLTRDWFTSVLAASKDPKGPQQVPPSSQTYSDLPTHTALFVRQHTPHTLSSPSPTTGPLLPSYFHS